MLRDTWVVFTRAMRISLRNPVWVVFGLMQPILYLVLFGPLLKSVAHTPGFPRGNAWQVFVPGLLIELGLFGAFFAGFGLISEWRAGVIERSRVTPASRVSLLLGRVLRDVVVLLVQATLLTVVAIPFGLRAPVGGVVIGIVVVAALGACFASVSYAAGLVLRSEDALAPLTNFVAVPLLLLSGILLPMSLAPHWLRDVANGNPLLYVVNGVRSVFLGNVETAAVGWGLLSLSLLLAVGLGLGTTTFRRESA